MIDLRRRFSTCCFYLLGAGNIVIEEASDVAVAVEAYRVASADFADQMIVSAAKGTGDEMIHTFDKKATLLTFATFVVK